MGRSPCCDKVGLKKGPWTPEEDQKLLAYIEEHGHGSWRALPLKAGLQRCGKSCRLRWTNYLRPDIKRGKFSLQEEQTIIQLHALLGNRWSAIATHLAKRTDNEIKNYWNTHLKKRLAKMGIDPVTHKPKNDALLSSNGADSALNNKNAANLSHMAQWESARLEAETRLVRESKLRLSNFNSHHYHNLIATTFPPPLHRHLDSPTCTVTLSQNINNTIAAAAPSTTTASMIEFVGTSSSEGTPSDHHHQAPGFVKEEGFNMNQDWNKLGLQNSVSFSTSMEPAAGGGTWSPAEHDHNDSTTMGEGCFTNLLLNDSVGSGDRPSSLSDTTCKDDDDSATDHNNSAAAADYYQDNKNYWNSILNLVNSSPSDDHQHDSPIHF